jgi:predicted nucleic acid-binding protein
MANEVFVFDTNHVSNLLHLHNRSIYQRIRNEKLNSLVLCEAVIYEVEKGLIHKNAEVQLAQFQQMVIPRFTVEAIQLTDWRVAARLWGIARSKGRQLSDLDVLIAAVTLRLKGTLVTNDGDFVYLPNVPTANWLSTP